MRPLSARRSAHVCVLDVGASKIVCLIAKLTPLPTEDAAEGRTHRIKIIGIGRQPSRGVKAGRVVDMEAAEIAIRCAVDAAERMAGVRAEGVIVNLTGGRMASHRHTGATQVGGRAVAASDVDYALDGAAVASARDGRTALHSLPTGFALDGAPTARAPIGMIGGQLTADLHIVSAEAAAARNLMLAVERCHLSVEAMAATPYAAGLSCLVEDEMELGAAVIDLGAGTTSMAVFERGRLVHCDAVAVGGAHVSMDVARGLTLALSDAERLKLQHGACVSSPADERETVVVVHAGEEGQRPTYLPKAHLTRIIRPRVEEILELARDRLAAAGYAATASRRLVLTGGASQLAGVLELSRAIVSRGARLGRPFAAAGLPDTAAGPGFAASVGLLVYPQLAGAERFEPARHHRMQRAAGDTYVAKVGRWLKESF
jgi:cell division protein FtsA